MNLLKTKKRKTGAVWLLVETFICILVFVAVWKVARTGYDYAKSAASQEQKTAIAEGEEITVTIPEGASTGDIAKILEEQGLIDHPFLFRIKSRFGDYDGTYKHGTYAIEQGLGDEEIMEILQHGAIDADLIKITIPEGYRAKQIGTLLEEKGVVTSEQFLEAVNSLDYDYDFIKDLPQREYILEGYLFPDTYFFKEETTGKEVVNKMLERFDQIYNEQMRKAVEKSPYSLDQIITIASIIEAEIQVPEEREKAAGVIYNRLDEGMKLQMCSTVLYALDKRREVLLLEDLEIDSPYNTYLKDGLPIGPIANPGEAAMTAAFYPEENDYFYFVLKADAQGEHVFTETYDEFLSAKEKYKQKF